MICVHCGKEIDNGQAFCPYCGSRVGGDAAPEAKAAKKDPRKLALPVAAVALLAVVGVGLANRMPSIDLQRYVTITAQGYDTLGKLDVSFDTDKLEADYGKRIADSFKKAMNDHKESTYGLSSLAADLYSGSETELFVDYCATGSADKTSGLRNGDVITYSWNESEDEAETLFGVKVKYSDITYTVSGLEKVNTFDAFDGVTVEFNGTAPQGTATVNSLPTAEAGGSLHYTLDTTDGLRNGDTVTLTASSNREDFSDCIEKYGAIPAETEKTFTVSGLNEYVTTPALLTDTVLDSLKAQAEDTFKAYAANHWDTDSESLIGMDYVGDYILTPKEDSFWVDNDICTARPRTKPWPTCGMSGTKLPRNLAGQSNPTTNTTWRSIRPSHGWRITNPHREQLPPRAEDLMLRAITLTARGCLSPLKAATLLPPFWSARGSARSTHRRFSPAKSGPRSPASMSTFAPKCQVQSWSRAFCTVLQGPTPQKNCRKWTMQAASRS